MFLVPAMHILCMKMTNVGKPAATNKLTLNLFYLGAGNRFRMQQLQQKDWIDQQIRER